MMRVCQWASFMSPITVCFPSLETPAELLLKFLKRKQGTFARIQDEETYIR